MVLLKGGIATKVQLLREGLTMIIAVRAITLAPAVATAHQAVIVALQAQETAVEVTLVAQDLLVEQDNFTY